MRLRRCFMSSLICLWRRSKFIESEQKTFYSLRAMLFSHNKASIICLSQQTCVHDPLNNFCFVFDSSLCSSAACSITGIFRANSIVLLWRRTRVVKYKQFLTFSWLQNPAKESYVKQCRQNATHFNLFSSRQFISQDLWLDGWPSWVRKNRCDLLQNFPF